MPDLTDDTAPHESDVFIIGARPQRQHLSPESGEPSDERMIET
ncbi:MAG: hypothetical protein R3D02_13275 [Hyphomicrobiales bacterium]